MAIKNQSAKEQQESSGNITKSSNLLLKGETGKKILNTLYIPEYINEKYGGYTQEAIIEIIDNGYPHEIEYILENMDKFEGIDHSTIINKLFEKGFACDIPEHINKFKGIDYLEIANKVVENQCGDFVAKYLKNFEGLNHREIFLKILGTKYDDELMEKGAIEGTIDYIDNFDGLDGKVANKLIEIGYGWAVIENINKFNGLDQDFAIKLIEAGEGKLVAKYIDKLNKSTHKSIAIKLIELGEGNQIDLEKFEGLDIEVAKKMIDDGDGDYVAKNTDRFQGLDPEFIEEIKRKYL